MLLVLVESPFAYKLPADRASKLPALERKAEQQQGLQRHIAYARLAMHDCFLRGEAPFASHLLYTQPHVLDDDIPDERALGIDAGLLWGAKAYKTVLYTDLGISTGMKYGIANAEEAGRPIEERKLLGWEQAANETPLQTLVRLGLFIGMPNHRPETAFS